MSRRNQDERGPYARLYLELVDDDKFRNSGIYDNDHHFAAFCRLLMIAEGAWPASAHLPITARRTSIKALSDAGLIDLQDKGRYRVHGLDAERERRSYQAKKASDARWNARSIPDSTAGASGHEMPSRAKQSKAKQSQAEQVHEQADDPLVLYADLVGRRPTQTVIDWINRLSTSHGDTAVCSAIVAATRDGVATNKLLGAVEEALSAAKREAIRRRPKAEAERTWRDDFRDLVAAGYEEAPA